MNEDPGEMNEGSDEMSERRDELSEQRQEKSERHDEIHKRRDEMGERRGGMSERLDVMSEHQDEMSEHHDEMRTRPPQTKEASLMSHPDSSLKSRWRLFCAIELPLEIRDRAVEHIARLREQLPHVRAGWERSEKLHLTLKFFGDVEAGRAPALSLAIERAAHSLAPFTLYVADAGAFPPHGPARVLWLGIRDSSGTLTRLHTALEDECAAADFAREQRPFRPHLTLARLRSNKGARELSELHKRLGFEPLELPVNELTLMRSELNPNGSRYTALSHHKLAL